MSERFIPGLFENVSGTGFQRERLPETERPEENGVLFLDGWRVSYSSRVERMPESAIEQGLVALKKWAKAWQDAVPNDDTWVRRTLGLPSLLTRFDCTIVNGQLKIYEIEERPAGVGLARILSQQFRLEHDALRATWPEYDIVRSSRRESTDDSQWARVIKLEEALRTDRRVLVRADPDETEYHELNPRSVSTLLAKGNKDYGKRMGLWGEVTDPNTLNWDRGFVLKTKVGSKAAGVDIWVPAEKPTEENERRRLQLAAKLAGQPEGMYVQDFHQPMPSGLPDQPYMINRVFFGYNMREGRWKYMGGFWNASPNMMVDGGPDTIYGPIVKSN